MQVDEDTLRKLVTQDLAETLLRVVLIVLLLVICVRVFTPFSHLVIVAMILAVALYPLYVRVVRWFGGRRGLAATALVLSSLLLLGAPIVLLGAAVTSELSDVYHKADEDSLSIKAPDPAVAEWPIVGPRVYAAWSAASTNLPSLLQKNREVVKGYAKKILAMAASTAATAGLFVLAIVVAGILMVFGEEEKRVAQRIFVRLTSPGQGAQLLELCIATIRSVATGVVGVAVIQAILLGVGFLLAGVPGAAVLALLVMFLGILQLPAVIISLPAVAWLWMSDDGGSTVAKVVFTVWFIVAGLADNVLKPLLLGRGVEAPMLVILIGAIGGMVTAGITGLFMGAVLLAVGYQIFMQWVDRGPPIPADTPE